MKCKEVYREVKHVVVEGQDRFCVVGVVSKFKHETNHGKATRYHLHVYWYENEDTGNDKGIYFDGVLNLDVSASDAIRECMTYIDTCQWVVAHERK